MADKYQVVMEHTARLRSCYLWTLKPRRFLWVAKFWAHVAVFLTGDDARLYRQSEAVEVLNKYRNWMGENRLGC